MLSIELIIEYEKCLLGQSNSIPQYYFSFDTYSNCRQALLVMQYAFETYLKWDPFMVRDYLTMDILEKLKLKQLIKYIPFPPELNPKEDLFYIAWKIYPETIHFSANDLILKVYKDILRGTSKRFPKEFFSGMEGMSRASVCLQYMIEHYIQADSVSELYELFHSPKGITLLRKYKLFSICEDLFYNAIDYLHYALPEHQKDNFLYSYYSFKLLSMAESKDGENA